MSNMSSKTCSGITMRLGGKREQHVHAANSLRDAKSKLHSTVNWRQAVVAYAALARSDRKPCLCPLSQLTQHSIWSLLGSHRSLLSKNVFSGGSDCRDRPPKQECRCTRQMYSKPDCILELFTTQGSSFIIFCLCQIRSSSCRYGEHRVPTTFELANQLIHNAPLHFASSMNACCLPAAGGKEKH